MTKSISSVISTIILFMACQNYSPKAKEPVSKSETPIVQRQSDISIAELTLASTVSITMQDRNRQIYGLGSGVIIDSGMVITNLHVVAGATFGYVQEVNDAHKHRIEGYLAIDKVNDLALLSVPTISATALHLHTNPPRVGEKIYAAGNPHGLTGTFSEGIVSSLRTIDNKSFIQITAPISPGSSGGPIVNGSAELIGIAVGGYTEGQNLNFAIPATYVAALLGSKPSHTPQSISNIIQQSKKAQTATTLQTDLREAIKIRHLKWRQWVKQGWDDVPASYISEFSILNGLSYPVSNIRIMFIVYDKTGTPVDYDNVEILPEDEGTIIPGLAKTFYGFWANREVGYKCEVRLIDFKIHYDK